MFELIFFSLLSLGDCRYNILCHRYPTRAKRASILTISHECGFEGDGYSSFLNDLPGARSGTEILQNMIILMVDGEKH